ncbi:aspartate/glutamate racemase family protein [Leucobacter muris]|uniref:Aspartate/glutamate racemase family protein n=1 Tax=Leucobacter muris TaxID=1935379 RepID=A0ABX5QIW7_9MICO|nr:amino acid racemase [Leucobacter muris]QAB18886.1 aspartate/glutamate racemase family protein [Leucobacter muris]
MTDRTAPRSPGSPGTGLVGVIGGMGPLATVDFYRRIVAASPAARDQDHLPLIIWGDPRIPDRSDALTADGADPTPAIRAAALSLVAAGAERLVVACNTAHVFLDRALQGVDVPLISLVDETVRVAAEREIGGEGVAILATDGTIASGVYQRAFAAAGVPAFAPPESLQRRVMQAIRDVKSGDLDAASALLGDAAGELRETGAGALLAACTELPSVLGAEFAGLPVLDPMALTAAALVRQQQRSPSHA